MKHFFLQILTLFLVIPSPTAMAEGDETCLVTVTGDLYDFAYGFPDVKFRSFDKGDTLIRAEGILQQDQVAIAFRLDGPTSLFFGDQEIFLTRDKQIKMRVQVTSEHHRLDLRKYDLIMIYRHVPPSLKQSIRDLISYANGERPSIPGYNCENALCEFMWSSTGQRLETHVYYPENVYRELFKVQALSDPDIYVGKRARSPSHFFQKMMDLRTEDEVSRMSKNMGRFLKSSKGIVTVAIGTMASVYVALFALLIFG